MTADTCRGTRDDGEPCRSPVVGPDGFCPAHRDGGRERVAEAARKGGEATARRHGGGGGLDPDDLPPLNTPDNAETWLEVTARAVSTGKIGHNEGRTVVRAVREWVRVRDAGKLTERVDELMDALAEWRQTGDPAPVLELVEGDAT